MRGFNKFAGSESIRHIHVAHLTAIMLRMMFKIDPVNFSERTKCGLSDSEGGGQDARNNPSLSANQF